RSVGHVQKVLSNADDERSLFNRINVNGRSQAIRWYVMNVGDPKDPLDDAVRKKRETSARQMEDAEESRPESEEAPSQDGPTPRKTRDIQQSNLNDALPESEHKLSTDPISHAGKPSISEILVVLHFLISGGIASVIIQSTQEQQRNTGFSSIWTTFYFLIALVAGGLQLTRLVTSAEMLKSKRERATGIIAIAMVCLAYGTLYRLYKTIQGDVVPYGSTEDFLGYAGWALLMPTGCWYLARHVGGLRQRPYIFLLFALVSLITLVILELFTFASVIVPLDDLHKGTLDYIRPWGDNLAIFWLIVLVTSRTFRQWEEKMRTAILCILGGVVGLLFADFAFAIFTHIRPGHPFSSFNAGWINMLFAISCFLIGLGTLLVPLDDSQEHSR
ncbi:MAG: acyltransferase, partial [Chloroflexota bacterium]|nr:acyltransferase [Chloroflexota bacterium]